MTEQLDIDLDTLTRYTDEPMFRRLMSVQFQEMRKYLELSIDEVSRRAGIESSRYEQIESGTAKFTEDEFNSLLNFYGIDVELIKKLCKIAHVEFLRKFDEIMR